MPWTTDDYEIQSWTTRFWTGCNPFGKLNGVALKQWKPSKESHETMRLGDSWSTGHYWKIVTYAFDYEVLLVSDTVLIGFVTQSE